MNMRPAALALGLIASSLLTASARAGIVSLDLSPPLASGVVHLLISYPDGSQERVEAVVPLEADVTTKRDLLIEALRKRGYEPRVTGSSELRIPDLPPGTQVQFSPGSTAEIMDHVLVTKPVFGEVAFVGHFDPIGADGTPALFTAGITNSFGDISVLVSADELDFATDGPIICQALFQRLAPRAPRYGFQVTVSGDRLLFAFDPMFAPHRGGVVFGTTSPGQGASATIAVTQDDLDHEPQLFADSIKEGLKALKYQKFVATDETATSYCSYLVVFIHEGNTFKVNDKICINCPTDDCPTALGFKFLDKDGNVECKGTWRSLTPTDCDDCPKKGKTGYKLE